MYIATLKVQGWLDRGYSEKQVFLMWNGGEGSPYEKKGINSHGVPYDSGKYARKALAYLR